jgi:hypothetical protein
MMKMKMMKMMKMMMTMMMKPFMNFCNADTPYSQGQFVGTISRACFYRHLRGTSPVVSPLCPRCVPLPQFDHSAVRRVLAEADV